MSNPVTPEAKPEVDSIVETIIYLYTESRRLTKGMARELGLTGPQLTVLKLLESLGDLSLSTLSERIQAQNSTVTGIVDRMEREELVRRERSQADRRVVHIKLTAKGRRIAQRIEVEPMEIVRHALMQLGEEDTKALLGILMRLQAGVREAIADGTWRTGRASTPHDNEPSGPR